MRSLVFIIILFIYLLPISGSDNPVYKYIEEENISALEHFLLKNDINATLEDSNTTLLVYAIVQGSHRVCQYLIEHGADVNKYVQDLSPLMHASLNSNIKIVRQLVENQANIRARNSLNNTVLFYAAYGGDFKICKIFLKNGIPLNHLNKNRQTAYDYAIMGGQYNAAKFLRSYYEKNMPDMLDGPYVKWKRFNRVKAFYIAHDSTRQFTRKHEMKFRAETDSFLMKGFSGDSLDYLLFKSKDIPSCHYTCDDRILVIGDIHGAYDSLVNFLINNGIINSTLQWTWGRGHVVFLGDIFDRGDKVTEALWLIYNLEYQASNAGGAVHLILGNHEVMVLQDNKHYISDKYRLLTKKLNINYSMLYSKHTILGRWLRTKNTIIKINDNLFVHAGLSPTISSSDLTIQDINEMTRYFLNHSDRKYYEKDKRFLILGADGPFWYRGFIEENNHYEYLHESEFEKVLAAFNADAIFVGHTNVDHITALYNYRVYTMDVPFYSYGHRMEAILMEGDAVFVLNSDGLKKRIQNKKL